MGRLTEVDSSGNWNVKGLPWENTYKGQVMTEETTQIIYGALCKLKDFEEICEDPEQLEKIDELFLEKCREIEELKRKAKEQEWIPVEQRLPENEVEVEITYKRKSYLTGEESYFTARAFYEDGTMNTEDSDYCWCDTDDWEYNEEKDAYIIPECWYEEVRFGEGFFAVDMPVIAWRPLPEPYRGDEE